MGNRMSTATPDAGPSAPPGPRASPNPLGGDVPMTKEREDELRRRFSPDGGEKGGKKGGKKKGGNKRGGAAARSPYRAHQGEILLDTRNEARPHRCNDRVEDVVEALFTGNRLITVPAAFRVAYRCVTSKPGEEPEEPYLFLHLPAPVRKKPEPERRGWFGWFRSGG
jgi:hypothetical protein